jgi:hypothetical protein
MRHLCWLGALALALLAPAGALADVVAREGKGWLEKRADGNLVLHLRGTPYEMGFQHGRLLQAQVKGTIQRVMHPEGKLAEAPEYTAYLMMRGLMHDMLRKHLPARFVEEMRGLAEGAGVEYAEVEAGNLFPEAFHCSGIALRGAATKDGSLYQVRILDYMTMLGLQDSAVVIVHEPEGGLQRWMNVTFAGFIGSVTGMNAAQVSIGEMGGEGVGYWDGVPMSFLIRDALERAGTLDEALAVFRGTKRTCEYYYVISDGKTREARGLWTTPEVCETIAPGESYAMFEGMRPKIGAAGGKAFGRGLKVEAGPFGLTFRGQDGVKGFVALQPQDVLVLSGPDRYGHFLERLAPRMGQVDEQVLMDLVKRPVSMKSNLHVAIFHPETLEVWVAVAAKDGAPACDQPYARYSLREESLGGK